jgi:hypothetical protein
VSSLDPLIARADLLASPQFRARFGRTVLFWVLIPVAIELVAWRGLPLQGGPGLDPSWEASLEMAIRQHLAFGTQVVFTFGPLGFLSLPEWTASSVWFSNLALLALANMIVVRFAVATVVFAATRRTYGALAGAAISLAVSAYAGPYADLSVLLIVLIGLLGRERTRRATVAISICGGAFAAVELLEKVSIGVSACVLIALFVVALPRDRGLAVVGAVSTFMPVLILAWLVVGQPLGALVHYLHGAEEIASGYSAAMQISAVGVWAYAAALLLAVVGALGAWEISTEAGKRVRVAAVLLWLFFCFSAFKEAFVRSGPGNTPIYFFAVFTALFAFRWVGRRGLALLAAGVALLCGLAAEQESLDQIVHQPIGIAWAYRNISDVANGSTRSAMINRARASVIATEPLPRGALPLLSGRTVAVYPWENALIWAYRLDWRPLPVLASYAAYVSPLDRLDANFLASSRAPARLIVQDTNGASIDTRVLSFDESEAAMEILCRYRPLLVSRKYAILGRAPDRCSAAHRVSTIHAGWGQRVTVPSPPAGSIVLVRINGVQVGGLGSIRNLVWSSALRFVRLNAGPPRRLNSGTAADGLPLIASPGIDFPGPYSVAAGARTISVSKAGQGARTSARPLTYSFYDVLVGPLNHPVARPNRVRT